MTTTAVSSGGMSATGPVREDNQDAFRLRTPDDSAVAETRGSLFAVADGMGGFAKGGVASTTAIESFFHTFYNHEPASPTQTLRSAMEQANLAVHQAAFRLNVGNMGTTLTGANVVGNHLYLVHIGDTRAYLIREGKATCLTNDHSLVGELVQMRVIKPDKVRTHHQRSVLTRHLGGNMFIKPELKHITIQPQDVILLCSDGLWAFVEDDEIARLTTQTHDTGELGQQLINLALERQTDDNISVIAIRIEQVAAHQSAAHLSPPAWRRVATFLGQLF